MSDSECEPENKIITCWCGERGTYAELFSNEPFGDTCDGSGFLYCYCGGDQCVCHHHGQEILCPGCEDCEQYDEDDDWNDDLDEEDFDPGPCHEEDYA